MNSVQKPMQLMKSFSQILALSVLLIAFGTTTAFAQEQQQQERPAYADTYEQAMQTARQASQLEDSDVESAAEQFEEAYRLLAEAAEEADEQGHGTPADQMRERSAQIAYRAGKLLYDNDYVEESIPHFEFGIDVDATVASNQRGLEAAQRSLQQQPVVDASQALNDGNPQEAIDLLEGIEDETGNVFFFRTEAHMQLNNYGEVISNGNQALEAGGLSTDRVARLHLLVGEAHMEQGDSDSARTHLEQAAAQGSPQISERAEALLGSL